MDDTLKAQAETLFAELGMNITTAFTIFTRAAVRQRGIPFEINAPDDSYRYFNSEAQRREWEDMKREVRDPNAPRFSSVAEMNAFIDAEEDEDE
jgi:DNA-damage-inducible protein J